MSAQARKKIKSDDSSIGLTFAVLIFFAKNSSYLLWKHWHARILVFFCIIVIGKDDYQSDESTLNLTQEYFHLGACVDCRNYSDYLRGASHGKCYLLELNMHWNKCNCIVNGTILLFTIPRIEQKIPCTWIEIRFGETN